MEINIIHLDSVKATVETGILYHIIPTETTPVLNLIDITEVCDSQMVFLRYEESRKSLTKKLYVAAIQDTFWNICKRDYDCRVLLLNIPDLRKNFS